MIRLGSRGSDLALTQSRTVARDLESATGERVEIEIFSTKGDRILDRPLPEVGGKGLFTEELEAALREGRIDLAVHSLKDLPVEDSEGLTVGAVPERAAVADVLVFDPQFYDDEAGTLPLSDGSILGTSSPRRAAAIATLRPGLEIRDLRGNVPTRVNKVREGLYHGILLARAGLDRLRLDLDGLEAVDLPRTRFVPAPGQGALGVQCRQGDDRILELLSTIHDEETARCAHAERALLLGLGGGCSMPFGASAMRLENGDYEMRAALANRSGTPAGLKHLRLQGPQLEDLVVRALERLSPLAREPLLGRRLVVVRPGGADSALQTELAVAGAEVHSIALTEALPIAPLASELPQAEDQFDLVATSARAVDRLFEELALAESDWRPRHAFAVGPSTARALAERGLEPRTPEDPAGGEALGAFLLEQIPEADRRPLLFPCALERHDGLETRLTGTGFDLRAVALYRIDVLHGSEWPCEDCDAVVWTSPSSVDAAAQATDTPNPETRLHLALGSTTGSALLESGRGPIEIAANPTPDAVLEALTRSLGR